MSAEPFFFSKPLYSLLPSPHNLADHFFRFFHPYPSTVLGGPSKNRKLVVAKQGLEGSGDKVVWKADCVIGHLKWDQVHQVIVHDSGPIGQV
ncbi:hypothetical protein L873DRAFT_971769 [Choiromyces venosus 120613-1]|uniref:Uncharacterized protein n=1 Tax=Choiromyces venosus 120613-1 TaxID=1336337 RepID=A0A3N4JLF0_9PEZI|nr:hypothetical protein L873DRAFT_971769 [Choiromyces venosus 120613-1]